MYFHITPGMRKRNTTVVELYVPVKITFSKQIATFGIYFYLDVYQ